jgi:hypothetical protein
VAAGGGGGERKIQLIPAEKKRKQASKRQVTREPQFYRLMIKAIKQSE